MWHSSAMVLFLGDGTVHHVIRSRRPRHGRRARAAERIIAPTWPCRLLARTHAAAGPVDEQVRVGIGTCPISPGASVTIVSCFIRWRLLQDICTLVRREAVAHAGMTRLLI